MFLVDCCEDTWTLHMLRIIIVEDNSQEQGKELSCACHMSKDGLTRYIC